MSRVAKKPIDVPKGVEITINGTRITVKGPKGSLQQNIHTLVDMKQDGSTLTFAARNEVPGAWAHAGTARALVNNLITGVSKGFERKLELVGVGYRAQAQGKSLNLTLGFSHPVVYSVPEGITIETPSQTEILIRGSDKQVVGQVAADIRSYRPPEPYKGKGVKYSDEVIVRKEAKKK
jgi:large subunit ribosomal protein L6